MSRRPLLLALLLAASASAQTFAPATHHVMGPLPAGLVVADLSGDGLLDVATANRVELTVSVRLGDGAGGLGAETSYPLPGVIEALDVVAGDITGDAVPDLVACGNTGNSSALLLLRGLGGGDFWPAVSYPLPCCQTQLGDLVLADFTDDGALDVAGGSEHGHQLYFAKNDDGAFIFFGSLQSLVSGCTDSICPAAVSGVATADVDEDGDADLLCTNLFEQTLVVFDGVGPLAFAQAGHEDLAFQPNQLLVRDLDEDAHVDALTGDGSFGVHFLAGDGAGDFGSPLASRMSGGPPPFITGPGVLASGDFDGDGRLDVAAAHSVGTLHEVLVAPGDGAGSFGPALSAGPTTALAWDIAAADLDRDGRADLVVTEAGSNPPYGDTLALLRNTTEPAPPWNDTGFALAGALGAPWLMTFGSLTAGSTVELSLSGALPGAAAVQVVGQSELYARFKGGTLVPFPGALLGPFAVQADGGLPLAAHWPAGVPGGVLVGVQWWVVDAGGPQGLAASNGVLGLVP